MYVRLSVYCFLDKHGKVLTTGSLWWNCILLTYFFFFLKNLNPCLNVNIKNSEGLTPLLLVTRDLDLFEKSKPELWSWLILNLFVSLEITISSSSPAIFSTNMPVNSIIIVSYVCQIYTVINVIWNMYIQALYIMSPTKCITSWF